MEESVAILSEEGFVGEEDILPLVGVDGGGDFFRGGEVGVEEGNQAWPPISGAWAAGLSRSRPVVGSAMVTDAPARRLVRTGRPVARASTITRPQAS